MLEPFNVVQKSILKVAFRKSNQYPTEALFEENFVLTVRKLYIIILSNNIFKNRNNDFVEIAHSHNIRYSTRDGIITLLINNKFSTTNSHYVTHIVYLDLCIDLNTFISSNYELKNVYLD